MVIRGSLLALAMSLGCLLAAAGIADAAAPDGVATFTLPVCAGAVLAPPSPAESRRELTIPLGPKAFALARGDVPKRAGAAYVARVASTRPSPVARLSNGGSTSRGSS
jgi:hypothetical protein